MIEVLAVGLTALAVFLLDVAIPPELETAKAVETTPTRLHTPLKQGVNEKWFAGGYWSLNSSEGQDPAKSGALSRCSTSCIASGDTP